MNFDDGHHSSVPLQWGMSSSSNHRSSFSSDFSVATSQISNGPLSPISTGIDIPISASTNAETYLLTAPSSLSSAPPLDTSTSSSSATPENSTSPVSHGSHAYGTNDLVDSDVGPDSPLGHMSDMHWETAEIDHLHIPKLEPIDEDDFRLEDLKEAPAHPEARGETEILPQSKVKRPRGRPRKIGAIPTSASVSKMNKGRSKTGCITCRKRKKKCDEAKPRCLNCEKNAVICEGYPEKQIWKSGKEKAEEELLKNHSLPIITMQPIFTGLETSEDRIFWKHYNDHLSAVFTVEGEQKNAFRDKLVPLATRHQGMMHSLLSLSSKHLDYDTPYGAKILQRTTKVTADSLQRRGSHHNSMAVKSLYDAISEDRNNNVDPNVMLAARYGQMLCLVLESLAEGVGIGGSDSDFYAFIVEIFFYHIFADDLLSFPPHTNRAYVGGSDWTPPTPIHAPRLIGVADGLFNHISEITNIRIRIRERIENNTDPRVDYDSLYRASDIESSILDWSPQWPIGDSRESVTLLYKQMTWLYLKMTICPPSSSPDSAPTILTRAGATLTDTPPRSASSSPASSPSPGIDARVCDYDNMDDSRRPSLADNGAKSDASPSSQIDENVQTIRQNGSSDLRASPPPIRRPTNYEPVVNVAVDETLALLESFQPSDPAQTLLLLPCVVVGTACYAPAEQARICEAIHTIHGYTGLRNTNQALEVLNEVWRLMDAGEYLLAWDWQAVAYKLGHGSLF
ncbi:c6 zinc finger domain containing protein [Grosmannia clavigera kw1407]|uniref:C6 zinc finger domain containing protein n=1 Tax=Grosmannia clavigera (strain kw1407 / UAMH 11150) TaxID=655863 RepID=F0X8Z3_GROCL|nr:c6 zinc finger domain containing protein [Grosmannia clavigera kw1407]EFX05699.1 c6 zinc finger domain containing protein [Grosmannia clavigera kw1407]